MVRWIIAIPTALICSLAVFSFMAWMVDHGRDQPSEEKQVLQFDMVMTEHEDAVQRRQRTVPKQPKPPEVPQMTSMAQMQTPAPSSSLSPMTVDMPSLGLDMSIHGVAIQAPQVSALGTGLSGNNQQAIQLYKVKPEYPPRALSRKIEGNVTLQFDIDETGRAQNIHIIESHPKRVFDRAAIRALRRWKFQPSIVDGKAMKQLRMTQTIQFEIEK
ncbi:energy transducer TonB [Vibrio sp. PP-XX7]